MTPEPTTKRPLEVAFVDALTTTEGSTTETSPPSPATSVREDEPEGADSLRPTNPSCDTTASPALNSEDDRTSVAFFSTLEIVTESPVKINRDSSAPVLAFVLDKTNSDDDPDSRTAPLATTSPSTTTPPATYNKRLLLRPEDKKLVQPLADTTTSLRFLLTLNIPSPTTNRPASSPTTTSPVPLLLSIRVSFDQARSSGETTPEELKETLRLSLPWMFSPVSVRDK
jgi:hypothetical protein